MCSSNLRVHAEPRLGRVLASQTLVSLLRILEAKCLLAWSRVFSFSHEDSETPPLPSLQLLGLALRAQNPQTAHGPASPTSDEQVGAVVTDAASGHDPQGVQAFVVLVQVAEGQGGLALPKEHLGPLGLFQEHV